MIKKFLNWLNTPETFETKLGFMIYLIILTTTCYLIEKYFNLH
jgi:hypothetical protein